MKQYSAILISLLVLAGGRFVWSDDAPYFGEETPSIYKEPEKAPDQPLVLPPYPAADRLLEVDLRLRDFPFRLWIDPASLAVDDEGVIRYTAVLRSEAGAENVIYEGVRCTRRQYRRYAYGAQGSFQLIGNSQWQFLRQVTQDRYRAALMDMYFCPLPSGDREAQLLRKLKYRHPASHE